MAINFKTARYIAVRLVQAVPLVLFIVTIGFVLIQLAPGDPVTALVGDFPVPEAYLEEVRQAYGLDRSPWEQYLLYLQNVFQGDLGYSFSHRTEVVDLIVSRLPATVILMVAGLTIAVIVGLGSGIVAALKPRSAVDTVVQSVSFAAFAMPVFWLGQMAVLIFSIWLGWFPASGTQDFRSGGNGGALEFLRYLTLPAFVLAARYTALNMRMTRAGLLESLDSDYVIGAHGRGLSRRSVVTSYALPNGLLPVVTMIGYSFGFALSGSVLVETVFAWPGIGSLLFDSITARDYPVVLGIFLFTTTFVVIVNLLTDLLYLYLDPRIKY